MPADLKENHARLARQLRGYDRLAVALSGGVDSALLLAEARDLLGSGVVALTARSPLHPETELADAARIASELSVAHHIIDTHESESPDFLANTEQRCYICKQLVFSQLMARAAELGHATLAHGANADDCRDYRPGQRAADELGVVAPLMAAGLTKAQIRQLARQRGLFVWDKPAMACLATRFPYGSPLRPEAIQRVGQAENLLAAAGFSGLRVRCHDDVARIEVPAEQLARLVAEPGRSRIVKQLRSLGFAHVSADLEGYVQGSLNRALGEKATNDNDNDSQEKKP